MKKHLGILIVLFAVWNAGFTPAGAQPVPDLDPIFNQAKRAYDAGDLEQAGALYQDILDRNYYSAALFFNMANTYFRAGNTGKALLYYRRAELLAPRDPDIKANQEFARKHIGLETPENSLLLNIFTKLSFSQWAGLTTGVYWAGALLVSAWLFRRKTLPGGWPRTTAALFMMLFLGGVGLWRSGTAVFGTEAVVLAESQPALYAPLENSTPHFSLPEGSRVRVIDKSDAWFKIASGKDTGWIPASSCAIVYPW